jgi:hypothetical protein
MKENLTQENEIRYHYDDMVTGENPLWSSTNLLKESGVYKALRNVWVGGGVMN